MKISHIGWIGLGNMGVPMSQQLIDSGYFLTVFNRTREKEAFLVDKGASVAVSPAELTRQTEAVILMVSDDEAVREVFTGKEGLLQAGVSGKIFINMSTVSPSISQEMAALCDAQGNDYVDAPVSGSVKQAETAQLVIMAGGKESVFQLVKPLLEKLGKLVLFTGHYGSGNRMKLAVNTLLALLSGGLAETVAFARKNEISVEDLIHVLNNSAMSSPYIKIKGDAILRNDFTAAFALKHIAKDLRLAKDCGLDTPLGITAHDVFQQAEKTLGEEDIIAVIKQFKGAERI